MITLTREEAEQLLAALCQSSQPAPGYRRNELHLIPKLHYELYNEAIDLLRARLSAPEPEPHGYLWFTQYMEKRFTHRKPEERERIGDVKPLYTTPPQREWQSLTDEEIRNEANHHVFDESFFNGAIWARGQIMGKNNG